MFGFLKKAVPLAQAKPVLQAGQIQPRIKHVNFLKSLRDAGVPPEQWPANTPLCGELIVTYAFDLPDSFMMATPALLQQAGVSQVALPQLARDNLAKALPQPKFFAKDNCGIAVTGGDLEATLLLVDTLWEEMQPNFSGEILVVTPCRDRILMCDSADADAVNALRQQAGEFYDEEQGAHRLSLQIMARRDRTWALHESH